jgi:hypothetical protein
MKSYKSFLFAEILKKRQNNEMRKHIINSGCSADEAKIFKILGTVFGFCALYRRKCGIIVFSGFLENQTQF